MCGAGIDNATVRFPLYSMMLSRMNAVKGRANNPAPPPWDMPKHLKQHYTMGDRVAVAHLYFDQSPGASREVFGNYTAPRAEIDKLMAMAKARKTYYYADTDLFLYHALADGAQGGWGLTGKHVVIVGSLKPWYEAICLVEEAASCTTIEYNKLAYEHPGLRTITVKEWEMMPNKPTFDVAVTISSLEHDGLGRYGDPLDPDGAFPGRVHPRFSIHLYVCPAYLSTHKYHAGYVVDTYSVIHAHAFMYA